jgi:class 3 adenylate cyclase
MSDLSARHDAIIREAIEVHRGQVVKTTGEGIKGVHIASPSNCIAIVSVNTLETLCTENFSNELPIWKRAPSMVCTAMPNFWGEICANSGM